MNQKKALRFIPLLVVIGGVILSVVSITIGLGGGIISTPTPTVHLVSPDQVPRVEVQDAKAAYEAGKAVFVDVRSVDAYNADHIPGALNIPLGQTEARIRELDPDDWIITY